MEQYLRCYINYLQDDWAEWLPCAEFAANNQASETTGISPFFANYNYAPRWTEEIEASPAVASPAAASAAGARPMITREANDHATAFKEITEHLHTEIARAQQRQQEAANGRRTPEPVLKVGDKVWLKGKNIITCRPSYKLENRRHGPFEITEFFAPNSYRLKPPDTMKNHPLFYISQLDPAANDPLPVQVVPPPPL